VKVDHVVVAVGIDANIDLARESGLEIDREHGGYRVDAELRARTDVWVVRCFVPISPFKYLYFFRPVIAAVSMILSLDVDELNITIMRLLVDDWLVRT
jgi:hypothetical protein